MLEKIVKRFRGVVLVFVVAMLSAVFVLQFGGPQASGFTQGSTGDAAEVYGEGISRNEYRSSFVLAGGDNIPASAAQQYKLEEMVLHGLVERNLLAREAQELGFATGEDEIMRSVAEDGVIRLSMSVDASPYLPASGPLNFSFADSDGNFSKKNLKNFIQFRLRRSIKEFAATQTLESLAQKMRDSVTASVTVGPSELWDAYVREKESVTLKYARFAPAFYAQQLEPTDEQMATWMKANDADVQAEYEKQKHRYTGLEKQVRARHILIKVAADASDEDKAAARARAAGLRERAQGSEDFAQLATDHSEDTGSAKRGGDLGYNPKGRMVAPFDEAQFSMEPGDISDLVETDYGFHVIAVEGIREGDVPLDEAKRELADKLYRERMAAERAKEAAEGLLARLVGGLSIEAAEAELLGEPPPSTAEAEAAEPEDDGAPERPDLDPLAPQFKETRPFGRSDTAIPGPFDSSPLVQAAYEMSEDDRLPDAPMKLGDDWFVYRLSTYTRANRDEFSEEDRTRIHNGLLNRKRREVLAGYVRELKQRALDDKAVVIDETVFAAQAASPGSQPPTP